MFAETYANQPIPRDGDAEDLPEIVVAFGPSREIMRNDSPSL